MNNNTQLFTKTIFNVYPIILNLIDPYYFNNMIHTNKELYSFSKYYKGFCTYLKFDYKINFKDFILRISQHQQHIKIINFNGYQNNNNINYFEWCPFFPKILIIHNAINLHFNKIIKEVEYLIVIDNYYNELTLNNLIFPNLKLIGYHKVNINIINRINNFLFINFSELGILNYLDEPTLLPQILNNLLLTYNHNLIHS